MVAQIANVAYTAGQILAFAFLGSLMLCKRPDVSWRAFFFAGPMVLVRPKEFLRERVSRIPPILFLSTMSLLVVEWIAHWYAFNM